MPGRACLPTMADYKHDGFIGVSGRRAALITVVAVPDGGGQFLISRGDIETKAKAVKPNNYYRILHRNKLIPIVVIFHR